MKTAPLVVWAIDMSGWCFDNIAKIVSYYNSDLFQFKIQNHATLTHGKCDILISMWWGNTSRLNSVYSAERVLGMIYDGMSWNINEDSKQMLRINMNCMDGIGVCNNQFIHAFKGVFNETPDIFLLEDGVNTELFKPIAPLPKEFCIGWVGNSRRITPGGPPDQKGLNFIKSICKAADVKLKVLDVSSPGNAWPHNKMPEFYNDISVISIGALMEGTPNPLLEGLACGRPALTTKVGLAPDIIKENENGWFINRDNFDYSVDKLKSIKKLKYSELTSLGIKASNSIYKYSWAFKSKIWREALINLLEKPSTRKIKSSNNYKLTSNSHTPLPLTTVASCCQPKVLSKEEEYRELISKIEEKSCILRVDRPIIYVLGLFRFYERTMRIISHLVNQFEFIPIGYGPPRVEKKPDLIWALYPYGNMSSAIDSHRRYNTPIIGTIRGEFWRVDHSVTEEVVKSAVDFYENANYIISLSDRLIDLTVEKYKQLDKLKFIKIPNGCYVNDAEINKNASRLNIDAPKPWIGILSNWHFKHKAKGAHEVITKINNNRNFTGSLLIGGTPGIYSPQENIIGKKVHNLGNINDVWKFYNSIDALIYHSYQDSQPSVIMEAMSNGTIVLVTETCNTGSHEIVEDGITGLVAKDIDTLLDRYNKLSMEDKLRIKNSAKARMKSTFSWEATAEKHAELFYTALKDVGYFATKKNAYIKDDIPELQKLSKSDIDAFKRQANNSEKIITKYEKLNNCVSKIRPTIYVIGSIRFESQTFRLLKHITDRFKFIPMNQGTYKSEHKPDLIFCVYPYQPGIVALNLKQQYNVPLVACMRGEFWHITEKIQQTSLKAATMIYENADAIICLANATVKNTLKAFPHLDENKFHVVPNGAYIEENLKYESVGYNKTKLNKFIEFLERFPKPWLGTLTNFSFKGKTSSINELVDWIEYLKFPGTLLIGGTPGRYELEKGKLRNNVYNFGEIKDIWTFYTAIHWYIHYTHIDAQPGTVLEALSFKTPVACIDNDSTGTSEFVENNKTGLIDITLNNLLNRIHMTDENTRIEMGVAGYNSMKENYSWKTSGITHGEIFDSILKGVK